jgi:acyl carrier protein
VEDLAEVVAALSDVLSSSDVAACDPHDTLVDLGIDSLTMIQFVAALERRFAVRLADRDLESLGTATLLDVCRLVREAAGSPGNSDGVGAGKSAAEHRATVVVRSYREADRDALARICVEGSSWGALSDLAPLFFLHQYLTDPPSCFVAELEGEIVGYWVGTLDVQGLQRAFFRHMAARSLDIARWYRKARPRLSAAERRRFWRQVLVERYPSRRRSAFILRQVGEVFGKTFVHFQVDRARAPAGTVFSLARVWMEHLRSRGIEGAMLPSVPGGPSTLEMWKRLGFSPVEVPHPDGTRHTWLLAVL